MIYAPHKLQRRIQSEIIRDEYGRIVSEPVESWEDVCCCRCDDNSTKEFTSPNGEVYRPDYHVVCQINSVKAGDYIRCLSDSGVRGEGEVYMARSLNYLGYTELWM